MPTELQKFKRDIQLIKELIEPLGNMGEINYLNDLLIDILEAYKKQLHAEDMKLMTQKYEQLIQSKIPEKVWCTQCDCDMLNKGVAMDCPADGVFFECPDCKHRIVVFYNYSEGSE